MRCGFASVQLDGSRTKLFAFAVRSEKAARLQIVEIDHEEGRPVFGKKNVDLVLRPDAPNDFPVAMQVSAAWGVVYVITKYGYVHVYEVESGRLILAERISGETIFVTAEHRATGGLIGVNRRGQVLSVGLDGRRIVSFLQQRGEAEVALRLAARQDLPGAEDLFATRFEQLLAEGRGRRGRGHGRTVSPRTPTHGADDGAAPNSSERLWHVLPCCSTLGRSWSGQAPC